MGKDFEVELEKRLASIDKNLAVYNQQLEYHIHRTDLLEEKLEHVDTHVKMVNGVFKFLLGLAVISGIVRLFRP